MKRFSQEEMVAVWRADGFCAYGKEQDIKACPFTAPEAIDAWRAGWLEAYDHDADGKEH